MSQYFQISQLELRNKAKFSQRRNYGGKTDSIHLECNSAYRLPFMIKVPKDFDLDEITNGNYIAHFRHDQESHMEADSARYWRTMQLHIRPMRKPTAVEVERGPLPKHIVVIERVFEDLLPLDERLAEMEDGAPVEARAMVTGYRWPEQPLPTRDNPLIVTSHTADGGGWYTYKIYVEE